MNFHIFTTDGKQLPINIEKLVIYENGKILFSKERTPEYSYFTTRNNEQIITSNSYIESLNAITIDPVKRALKENLNRNDNYTLGYTPEYFKWEKRTALYIHASNIHVIDLGLQLASVTEEERNYLQTAKLKFKYPVEIVKYHIERIELNDEESKTWKLPNNGKWSSCYGTEENPCYDTYNYDHSFFKTDKKYKQGVIKRWITKETVNNYEIMVTEDYYRKTEYSDERIRKNNLAQRINDSKQFNESWSHYTIDKLEKALGYKLQ